MKQLITTTALVVSMIFSAYSITTDTLVLKKQCDTAVLFLPNTIRGFDIYVSDPQKEDDFPVKSNFSCQSMLIGQQGSVAIDTFHSQFKITFKRLFEKQYLVSFYDSSTGLNHRVFIPMETNTPEVTFAHHVVLADIRIDIYSMQGQKLSDFIITWDEFSSGKYDYVSKVSSLGLPRGIYIGKPRSVAKENVNERFNISESFKILL